MSKITLSSVRKEFYSGKNRVLALEDATLEIADKETVCIVGPSGCGKTTVLNLIAGFLQASSGEVRVGDRPVIGPGDDRAVVFQSDAVFPWMTVARNVGFGSKVQKLSGGARADHIDHYLGLVGLRDFASSYPKALSGGMRKRVDIARAYANTPEVLLLDEPFGALDVFTRESMWLSLRQITKADPRTVVFVTHDIEEALFLGDRVVIMTPRPARIHSVVDVPFGEDRDLDLRDSIEFQALRATISHSLRDVQS
ncbi:ABC transporter ATP-binding protein [Microbacterium sp. CJ77]|uniref:ABC transporter ATP-binding protein n=1 Tax=Microbacterium sp. CJ77 TaxID=2079201 RepID=UPI001C67F9BB|nr:ABC transporter ATP-binding protein [Microbacterium sp. CJ77]